VIDGLLITRPAEPGDETKMSDQTLRLLAREAIQSARIPDRRPERMWEGAGHDDHCTICNGAVGELGLDLEFAHVDGAVKYPVHIDCFAAWELECKESEVEADGRSPLATRGS
jgi:hypothetical protein